VAALIQTLFSTREKHLSRYVFSCLAFTILSACNADKPDSFQPAEEAQDVWPQLVSPVERDPAIEGRVDAFLATMTLEQKVGQMIQAEIKFVTPDEVREYELGSVLNGGGSFPNGNKHSSVNDWVSLADAFYDASMNTANGRLAIPVLWGTDSVHGVNNVYGATVFPHNIGLGATRNTDLIRRIGEVTALETAVIGIPWTFGPTLAVVRDDRWGRTYEGYSEDPDITKQFAGAMVEGLQGALGSEGYLDDSRVLATAKHFLGDGGTDKGVDTGNNLANESELFAVHGQGYVSALGAGVRTIMVSFSSWQGQKMHANNYLLTEILKQRMGFDGLLVGDWNGHGHVPGCGNDSCAAAINAGIDLFMVPEDWQRLFHNTLEQVRSGEIPSARIDDAVRRILRVKIEAGLFEKGRPSSRQYAGKSEHLGSEANRAVARQAVRESLVLLKNNNQLLPLNRDLNVLVAGAGADDIARQSGGWTLTWQGTENENADFPGATSIFGGIQSAVSAGGGVAVLSEDGSYDTKPDVAIVVFGEDPYAEFQGDLSHLNYNNQSPEDLLLLQKLKDDGIPVVSIFLSGRPLWVNPHLNASDAFVAAWLPGSEGGGVADVIFRAADAQISHNFKGKLSYSWPRAFDQNILNVGAEDYDPLFAYGYGLTYNDEVQISNDLPAADAEYDIARPKSVDIVVKGLNSEWAVYVAERALPGSTIIERELRAVAKNLTDGFPSVSPVSRDVQEDSLRFQWHGESEGHVLFWPVHVSMLDELPPGRNIEFDLRLEAGLLNDLQLITGCNSESDDIAECRHSFNIEEFSDSSQLGQWQTIKLGQLCVTEDEGQLQNLSAALIFAGRGPLTVALSDLKIVAADTGDNSCAK